MGIGYGLFVGVSRTEQSTPTTHVGLYGGSYSGHDVVVLINIICIEMEYKVPKNSVTYLTPNHISQGATNFLCSKYCHIAQCNQHSAPHSTQTSQLEALLP